MDPFRLASVPTATSILNDSFTLPTALLRNSKAPDANSLAKQVGNLSLRQRRPAMTETFDPATVAKLSQRFETRLKISENSAKTVFKSI